MGNSCCPPKSPCGSAEERSGLLKDESEVTCTGDRIVEVEGTCGPEAGDEMRKAADGEAEDAQTEQSPAEDGETEPNNSQGNGPLRGERTRTQTATTSPRHASEPKENGETAPDSDPADPRRCTLNPTADSEVSPASDPGSGGGEPPPGGPAAAWSESSSPPRGRTETAERVGAVAKPSGALRREDEALPEPNPQPAAVSQDTNTEARRSALADDSSSSVSREDASEDVQSHAVSKSSSGLEPTGLGHSVEDQDSASSTVSEPGSTSPAAAGKSPTSKQEEELGPESPSPACSGEPASWDKAEQDAKEEAESVAKGEAAPPTEDGIKEEEEEEEAGGAPAAGPARVQKEAEAPQEEEEEEEEEQLKGSTDLTAEAPPAREDEEDEGSSEEDLYRAEEQPAPQSLQAEDRCSLAPAVDVLSYSEREWRGNTAKSALIRKGYKELSQRFVRLRRVRGDNYCALRATLFQVLSQSTRLPAWLQEDAVATLPMQLGAQEGLVSRWRFPGECSAGGGSGDAAQQLTGYLERLQKTWRAAAACPSPAERLDLCQRLFQGGEEELGLLEALKLLMLGRAVELHARMRGGGDVPLFCWLLFARDSSDCPQAFLSNHLRHVGLSAGLEQVEMFLLGYALRCTIQVYRLYKADTEEFLTYYPDDHKDQWEQVCLVTEDDRHYNVPVGEAAEPPEELTSL
ncbi:uncharacterized protein ACNS7B_022814 isoform 1-T2 [Menidia menidia]